ncbi:MAG: hypothetical protein AAFV88_03710 [Planctomycetota bacterium]
MRADSALDLLSGFDAERLRACYPLSDTAAVAEMSKLLYRVRRLDEQVLADRASEGPAASFPDSGNVVRVAGEVTAIRGYRVPDSLTEFLGMSEFREITLKTDGNAALVFVPQLPAQLKVGDAASCVAIDLSAAGDSAFVAAKMAWFPAKAERLGWRLMAERGVDLSLLSELGGRNRQPLLAADAELFYETMRAADELRRQPADSVPDPESVDPVRLLQSPQDYFGGWVRLDLKTIRLTRVVIENEVMKQQLGQDFYWQIDASGDLGKTVIQLQRPGEESIQMSGYYPVTLVSKSIPGFLKARVEDSAVDVMVDRPVRVAGFFLRLWSFENEFMQNRGGGKQVAPLVVASLWQSSELTSEAAGIEVIGYTLALFIVAAIVVTFLWTRRNTRTDRKVKLSTSSSVTIDVPR